MSVEAPGSGHWEAATSRSGWPVVTGIVLALLVLGLAILLSLLHLRQHIFEQIANRDGETLEALAAQQYLDDKANDESITTLEDPGEQLDLALKISHRLRSVYGVRFFSPNGRFVNAMPPFITETSVPQADLKVLSTFRPVSHFVGRASLAGQDLLAEPNSKPEPLLEVNIPLREPGHHRLVGIAQFLIYGASIAQEYAELDKHLVLQGTLLFGISGLLLSGGLLLAFHRLQRTNALLAERTYNLLKANRELALAAKTSAIGAVTSHLIHGLKNPLSGLKSFVQDRAQDEGGAESDWQLAVASTQRMQLLIDRVVRVLQEQQSAAEYELSFEELLQLLTGKLQPLAQAAGVRLLATLRVRGTISNRQADLVLLVLENLLQNAIDATPRGKVVSLGLSSQGSNVLIEVEDQGPGLRPEMLEKLFCPCASTKKGGSGIGLAISRQLAIHLGATLELKHSSAQGSCFQLVLPVHNAGAASLADSFRPAAPLLNQTTEV